MPAAVGVDIGCGMMARADVADAQRPARPPRRRCARDRARRAGRRTDARRRRTSAAPGQRAGGAHSKPALDRAARARSAAQHRAVRSRPAPAAQLGTLGGGNHFIELCLDEADRVWVDAALGLARHRQPDRHATSSSARKEDMRAVGSSACRDRDLAYLAGGHASTSTTTSRPSAGRRTTPRANRERDDGARCSTRCAQQLPAVRARRRRAVNCHHNYVERERHFGEDVWVTRKGAVRARRGRARHHPGLDGRAELHRARQGQPAESSTRARTAPGRAMSRTRGEAPLHGRRTTSRRPTASSAARTLA